MTEIQEDEQRSRKIKKLEDSGDMSPVTVVPEEFGSPGIARSS
jgi:hypothetical protein